jgi:hypothetical protein
MKLRFNSWLHYMNAAEYLFARHTEFTWNRRQMELSFFSEANCDEMKRQFDILGWKCEKLDK